MASSTECFIRDSTSDVLVKERIYEVRSLTFTQHPVLDNKAQWFPNYCAVWACGSSRIYHAHTRTMSRVKVEQEVCWLSRCNRLCRISWVCRLIGSKYYTYSDSFLSRTVWDAYTLDVFGWSSQTSWTDPDMLMRSCRYREFGEKSDILFVKKSQQVCQELGDTLCLEKSLEH